MPLKISKQIAAMKPSHIEHIGIAVRDLESAVILYEKILGRKCNAIETVVEQQVRTAFFKVGETKIELLESTDPGGTIARFIDKRGEGIHHIALAVDHVGEALGEVADMGIGLIDQVPRKGAEGLQIGFLHPKSTHGVLIELCGEKS
jgi:methylmalonyl-CoA/ethylmalonyl-CoA epimerase